MKGLLATALAALLAVPLVVRDVLVPVLDGRVVVRAHGNQQQCGDDGKTFHDVKC